jgi:hypothetical protein
VLLQQEKKRSSNKEHGQGSGLWDANRPCSVTIVPLLVADGRRPVAKDESSRGRRLVAASIDAVCVYLKPIVAYDFYTPGVRAASGAGYQLTYGRYPLRILGVVGIATTSSILPGH